MRIVITHLAQPRHDHGESPELHNAWCEQLDLAKLPDVWFDVAALPYYATPEPYPYPAAQAWVREAVDRIGADSVLFGGASGMGEAAVRSCAAQGAKVVIAHRIGSLASPCRRTAADFGGE